MCFAYDRLRQLNGNSSEAFLPPAAPYEKEAQAAAESAMQPTLSEVAVNRRAAGQVLTPCSDRSMPAKTPFGTVRKKAFSRLQPESFPAVSDYLRDIGYEQAGFEWSYYGKLPATCKRDLRHLFAELECAGRVEEHALLQAIAFLQELLRPGKSPRQAKPSAFPLAFLPKSWKPYVFTGGGKEKRLL